MLHCCHDEKTLKKAICNNYNINMIPELQAHVNDASILLTRF